MARKISKEMTFGEVIEKFPQTIPIMLKYNLHCVGCHVAGFETLLQGASSHGMSEEDLEKMLSETSIEEVVREMFDLKKRKEFLEKL